MNYEETYRNKIILESLDEEYQIFTNKKIKNYI